MHLRLRYTAVLLLCTVLTATAAGGSLQQDPRPEDGAIRSSLVFSLESDALILYASFPNDAPNVRVALHNLLGVRLHHRTYTEVPRGEHSFRFDTRGLPNGAYFVVLETPDQRVTKKTILNR